MVELVLNQPIFLRAACVDLSGEILASSELGRGLKWQYPAPTLESITKGNTYLSEVKILDNYTPYMTMAVPLKKMGKVVAVLMADINLRGVWAITDNITLGNTGRTF